jgi:hypothetical protein
MKKKKTPPLVGGVNQERMINMKDLSINRVLDEETRKQAVCINGEVYSLHITTDEVIITDFYDYTKIYSVQSWDFFVELERQNF